MATNTPGEPRGPLSVFQDFIGTLDLDDFTGLKPGEETGDEVAEVSTGITPFDSPLAKQEAPLALPSGQIHQESHDCRKFERMFANATKNDRPEKVKRAIEFFKACPNCRRRAWAAFENLDKVLSIKDEEEYYSQD